MSTSKVKAEAVAERGGAGGLIEASLFSTWRLSDSRTNALAPATTAVADGQLPSGIQREPRSADRGLLDLEMSRCTRLKRGKIRPSCMPSRADGAQVVG